MHAVTANRRHRLQPMLLAMAIVIAGAAGPELSAQDADASTAAPPAAVSNMDMSLGELLRLAASDNPAVQAARLDWRAAIEKLPQVRSLPDPMVRFDYFGESVQTRVGPQEYRVGASQQFPFPGTLRQAERVAAEQVAVQQAIYDQTVQDTILAIRTSYAEIAYLNSAMAITGEHVALLTHIAKLAAVRAAEDRAKLSDVVKAQSQLAQLSYDLILLEELKEVESATLNSLINRTDGAPPQIAPMTPTPAQVLPQVEKLEAIALENRPELGAAAAMSRQATEAIRLAQLRNRPMFSVDAMRIGTGDAVMPVAGSGTDAWTVGIAMSIPLWRSKNDAAVREAELRSDAAEARIDTMENATRAAVRAAWFRLVNATRLMELYDKTLIPQARQAMAIAEQWADKLPGDEVDLSGFLETRSVWLNFTLARLRATADARQYQARLERLLGGPMPVSAAPTTPEVSP